MTVTVLTSPADASDPEADVVMKQRREHAARVDPTDTFKTVPVIVELGPKNTRVPVTLRHAIGSTFLFAVYGDNPAFHDRPREEWQAGAKAAIEKFSAIRRLRITFGPRPEDMAPLNVMAELSEAMQ